MLTLNDGRSELWQWDTGRTLSVDADCSQVHFSNKVFGRSIDVDVFDGVAVIPDILLQTDKDLNVWAFVGTAENGYTKISKIFTVNRRNKPADYVFTPTDHMTLQMIQRQIGDLADLTTEAKENLVAAINEAARTGGGAGSMELRVADGYVQYSTDGGSTWENLIAMADLKGDPGTAGKDGHSPVVTATKSGKTTTISVDGADIATVEDGADGAPGSRGADGITPTIGPNGNWFLGEEDTGKPSRGEAGATDEQVTTAVSTWLTAHPEATTTVQDGAVTKEKIHDNAVGAHELDIDFSNNLSTLPDNPNVIKVATGWEAYVTELRQAQVYPNGVLWAFHCEAGKCYRIQPQYAYQSSLEPLFTPANPENATRINNKGSAGFICDRIIAPKAGAFSTQDGYIANTWHFGLPQGLDPVYATIFNNVSTVRARAEFRCEKDFWMYWLSASDVSAEVPYIGGSAESIREIPEPTQAVLESGGWFSTSVSNSATYIPPYKKSFSGYAEEKSGGETSEDSVHGIRRYVLPKDISGAVARSSRDPADYRINALVIGDSITYAASNAGLQNAWRKYISTRLNIGEIALAVSGTGIIKGAPYDFKGNANGSEAYSEDMSGYPGIVHWVNSYLGNESTFEFPGTNAYARNLLLHRSSIAIVALGTNDWSANSTLGSVDTIGDETTFYGAVQKTYTFLHEEVGIPCVLFVAPFKRQGWNQPNQATTPYTIYDMCHALAEIACINTDMYVLDCLDRWYLNYDDETIRSRSFIDNVHIKPYAHHLFTIDLSKEIRAILSAKGIV